jgi:glycosyltransferase involved in cell wall biosynthesis
VIVLNCKGRVLLEGYLNSVFNSYYKNLEIVLVDNGSVNRSVEFAKEKFGNDLRLKIPRAISARD